MHGEMFCCRPGSVVQAVVDSWLTLARRPWHQCLCLWKSSTAKTVAVIMSHSQRNFIAVGSMTDAWEALAYIQSMNKQAPEGPHILWWHSEAPGPAKGLDMIHWKHKHSSKRRFLEPFSGSWLLNGVELSPLTPARV